MKISIFVLLLEIMNSGKEKNFASVHVNDEYDFIIVGGGTTGSVIASRLSENPNFKILLLEAGGSDLENPKIQLPRFWKQLQRTSVDWAYSTEPFKDANYELNGKGDSWPRGKVLGGSSSINAMVYIRGSPHDYNSWKDHGATGWSWEEVEPYFRRVEKASSERMSENLGKQGPLKITRNHLAPMHHLVVQAAQEIGYEYKNYTDGMNKTISPIISSIYAGIRQTPSGAYIHPILAERKERLHVVLNALVTKVTLKKNKSGKPVARGVEYIKDGKKYSVKATKEVIVCGGVIGSPHLLMLSGIGPKNHLEKFKIKTVVDQPGVGSNLQDHHIFLRHYNAKNMPAGATENRKSLAESVDNYIHSGSGPWATPNGLDTMILLRTSLAGTSKSLSQDDHPFPELEGYFLSERDEVNNARNASFRSGLVLMHPKSSGTIRLKSKDPTRHPAIASKLFEDEDDISVFIEGIQMVDLFESTKTFKDLDVTMIPPSYCGELLDDNNMRNRSDAYYKCLLKHRTYTMYDPCCTAKMGFAEDEMAVVDSRLRVNGVDGLRVADASVMPHQISVHLQATCYMIGEKAADMIKEDWN